MNSNDFNYRILGVRYQAFKGQRIVRAFIYNGYVYINTRGKRDGIYCMITDK
ncbi:hypothetical protein FACS1894184_08410 [Clostridia bacterium]|nr:hypothetical protein FACS1894184_08410 [Clostridia bacterium]